MVGVKSNAYTLNSLIQEVSNVNPRKGQTADGLIIALSPRMAAKSVKFRAINNYLNGKLNRVLQGTTTVRGSSPRTRLLNALITRKNTGSF